MSLELNAISYTKTNIKRITDLSVKHKNCNLFRKTNKEKNVFDSRTRQSALRLDIKGMIYKKEKLINRTQSN